MAFYAFRTQLWPPAPEYIEDNVASQAGKVFIVTGGNSGVGLELVKMLYSKGARVYMASRSAAKAQVAITAVKAFPTATPGEVKYLHLDLADLATMKASAEEFSRQETELHVLWHNAGVTQVPLGSKTPQGHDLSFGTTCLGPFLFTQLLQSQLRRAAATAPKASVRIIFTGSRLIDENAPQGGLVLSECSVPSQDKIRIYASSKAGAWFLSSVFARSVRSAGIVCVTQNPGNLRGNMWENVNKTLVWALSPVLHHPKFGAYTALWAGLSRDVTMDDTGRYAIPWGRWHPKPRQDILNAIRSKSEGGIGLADEFWEWCEDQTRPYL